MNDKPTFQCGTPERRIVYAFEGEVAGLHAEIERLRAAIKDIADMQDDDWNEVKYHAMRDWAAKVLTQQLTPEREK